MQIIVHTQKKNMCTVKLAISPISWDDLFSLPSAINSTSSVRLASFRRHGATVPVSSEASFLPGLGDVWSGSRSIFYTDPDLKQHRHRVLSL